MDLKVFGANPGNAQNNAPSVSGFAAHQEDVASRTITIDDGLTVQNPDPIFYPAPGLNSKTLYGWETQLQV